MGNQKKRRERKRQTVQDENALTYLGFLAIYPPEEAAIMTRARIARRNQRIKRIRLWY